MKNVLITDDGIKLIDHSPSLAYELSGAKKLNCTFPWVDSEDYKNQEVTERTDELCLRATILRLSDFGSYIKLRKEQSEKLASKLDLVR